MANKMETNRVIRGNFGKVWVNDDEWMNVKSFEAKVSAEYEDVNIPGKFGTEKRYVGFSGEGTIVTTKIDSGVSKLVAKGFRTGNLPSIKIVATLADPTAYGAERVEILDVTLNELMVMQFENKKIIEEEVPFNFADYNYIDSID
jgi:phage-like element pbsx protein xkdM|nr:MAG TPA: tail tube protein [Caudoviricetes sp.]